ncbi:MAG: RNA polymerase sigma factor [Leptospiraceae bacterium]|nr:MAG: RNA polymerase sigma factor [Leptospiraceae bacterium]
MSKKDTNQQSKLIEGVLNGNTGDFITLIEPYYERLFIKAYSIVKEENDAKDILQEALISAFLALPKFKKESNIYTWLYKIVVNKAFDFIKSKKREYSYINPDINPYSENLKIFLENEQNIEEKGEQNELYEYLISTIESLEDKYKEILKMRYFDGLTYEEIAEIKQIKLGTVKSRIHKAKELLKQKLIKEGKFVKNDFIFIMIIIILLSRFI